MWLREYFTIFSSILLPLAILLFISWHVRRRKIMKALEKIPGPPTVPIFGNALELASSKALLGKFEEYREKYGGIVKLSIGSTPSVLLTANYKLVQFILNSSEVVNKSKEYNFLNRWLGTGLLTSDGGPKWKKHRKALAFAFHLKILEGFPKVFEVAINILTTKLYSEIGKHSVDVSTYIKRCMLDLIADSVMGVSINAQENSESDYIHSVNAMTRIIIERSFNPFLQIPLLYRFSSQYRRENKALQVIRDFVNVVIERKEREFISNFNINYGIESISRKKRLAFLDLMLYEKLQNGSFTDEHIREEVNTFMFAGYDTTASAANFCILCLAENQEVQAKAVKELHSIFGDDKSRCADYKDLQQMKYLEAVIKESLRLYPPVPFVGRNVHTDLQYDGITIPKGLTLSISIYGLHRTEELFPNPNEFNPDRFLIEENSTSHYPLSHIPFSAGPRNCIGQKFAMLAIKAVLSAILRNFQILPSSPNHKAEICAETVLTTKNGICVCLLNRSVSSSIVK